jgi:hypothetical protein
MIRVKPAFANDRSGNLLAAHTTTALQITCSRMEQEGEPHRFQLFDATVESPPIDYTLACDFRHAAGGMPTIRLNARENAASES